MADLVSTTFHRSVLSSLASCASSPRKVEHTVLGSTANSASSITTRRRNHMSTESSHALLARESASANAVSAEIT